MSQTSGALRAWFRHAEPLCPELFNIAFAICGNDDLAEQALVSTLLELYRQNVSRNMGFHERARTLLRDAAFAMVESNAAEEVEFNWPGLPETGDADPILAQALQERPEVQRLLLLKYGCGLSLRRIAALSSAKPARIRAVLDRYEARCRRNMGVSVRGRIENRITQRFQQLLDAARPDMPTPSHVYRAFEAEASTHPAESYRLPQLFSRILLVVMALLCAILFWFFAILVQPEALPSQSESAASETVSDSGVEHFEP